MYCPKCGKELIPNTGFCMNCGINVPKAIDELNVDATNVEPEKIIPPRSAATVGHQSPATEKNLSSFLYLLLILGLIVCMMFILNMDLVQAVAWVVIGLLIWWFIKPYVVIGRLDEKNKTGIQTNLTQDQIIALLEENPWCSDQLVRPDDSEIPKSQHRSQIYFRGIRAQVNFFIKDGILHAYGTSANKVQKLRRLYLPYKETGNLLRYIAALENGDAAAAKRLKRKNGTAIKLRSMYDTLDHLCWLIAVVLVIGSMIYSFQKHPVHDLKGLVFGEYGTLSLEDAVKENVRNVEWEQEKISKTHYRVTLTGFLPKEYANISLIFDVNYTDDHVYAHADAVIWNGDQYDNSVDISYALNSIYGNEQ